MVMQPQLELTLSQLEQTLSDMYAKFKLSFYRKIFKRFEEREASLTAVETFCVEVIHALGRPTISEFADFVMISQANAAYKVQSLIKKGYLEKQQSEVDRREYRLCVTEKFHHYYGLSQDYIMETAAKIATSFSMEEISLLGRMLEKINSQIMTDIELRH